MSSQAGAVPVTVCIGDLGLVTAVTGPKCVRMRATGFFRLHVCHQSPANVVQLSLWGCQFHCPQWFWLHQSVQLNIDP